MALPAEARRRWGMTDGGAVEIADLGDALAIVPAGRGGPRFFLATHVHDAGGSPHPVAAGTAAHTDPP